jgi:anti-anti-sigma regulatory factor
MNRSPKRYKSRRIERKIITKRHMRSIRFRRKKALRKTHSIHPSRIIMPEKIGLEEGKGRTETLNAVEQIIAQTVLQRTKIVLDFSKTTYPDSMGMIYLLALADLIRAKAPSISIKAVNVRSDRVRQVLQQIGLAEKLGFHHTIPITRDDVRLWRCISGASVDASDVGADFESLCNETQMSEESRNVLFNAMTEAIDNAYSHAYDQDIMRGHNAIFPDDRRWWMFFGVVDQRMVIVICDLGLGIPSTVQRKGWWENVRQSISNDDGSIIQATIEHARSRTHERHRGKGMAKLRQAAEENGGGLMVCSDRGRYVFKSGQQDYHKSHRDAIQGTVIGWMIPLQTRPT